MEAGKVFPASDLNSEILVLTSVKESLLQSTICAAVRSPFQAEPSQVDCCLILGISLLTKRISVEVTAACNPFGTAAQFWSGLGAGSCGSS